jgi:hypothetical protein
VGVGAGAGHWQCRLKESVQTLYISIVTTGKSTTAHFDINFLDLKSIIYGISRLVKPSHSTHNTYTTRTDASEVNHLFLRIESRRRLRAPAVVTRVLLLPTQDPGFRVSLSALTVRPRYPEREGGREGGRGEE